VSNSNVSRETELKQVLAVLENDQTCTERVSLQASSSFFFNTRKTLHWGFTDYFSWQLGVKWAPTHTWSPPKKEKKKKKGGKPDKKRNEVISYGLQGLKWSLPAQSWDAASFSSNSKRFTVICRPKIESILAWQVLLKARILKSFSLLWCAHRPCL
jgi:hypothetical protein